MTATPSREEVLADLYAQAVEAAKGVGTEAEAVEVAERIEAIARKIAAEQWEPYPWQHPHVHPPGWVSLVRPGHDVCDYRCLLLPPVEIPAHDAWLQRGGRGTGKTEGAAHYTNRHAEGPPCDPRVPGGHRMTIVAPTQADAVTSCVTGPSGLRTINPGITLTTNREGTTIRWPNGAVARLLGAHTEKDVERLRAWTNVCCVWVEEAAAQPQLEGVMEQVPFTLRLGGRPHMVITTTPKNRAIVKGLIDGGEDDIAKASVQTWGRTEDADHLAPVVRQALERKYRGSTLGRQELDGDLLADVEGALWVAKRPALIDGKPNPDERPGIDNDRVKVSEVTWRGHLDDVDDPVSPTALVVERVVVAVDPAGGATENGIVVVGTIGRQAYVLADLSIAGPPDTWAKIAIQAYYDYGAEGIAAEKTYGGDMVDDVLGTRDNTIPILKVSTKVGKRLRAEPVQALYQQHRVHHVGEFPLLEGEQTGWVPDETPESPNRLDALVHGVTYLLVKTVGTEVNNPTKAKRRVNASYKDGTAPGGIARRRPGAPRRATG